MSERIKGHDWKPDPTQPLPYEAQTPTEIDIIFRRLYQFSIVKHLPPESTLYQRAKAELEYNGAFQETVIVDDSFDK